MRLWYIAILELFFFLCDKQIKWSYNKIISTVMKFYKFLKDSAYGLKFHHCCRKIDWILSLWEYLKWLVLFLIDGHCLQRFIPFSVIDPVPTYLFEWTIIIFGLRKTIFPRCNAKHGQTFMYLVDIHAESILNWEYVVSTVVFEVTGPV